MPIATVPLRRLDEGSLRFHPLTFLDEGEDVVVGRADVDAYAVLPGDGAALLRVLYDGAAVQDAASWYAREFGETVDAGDFVASLRELGFVDDEPAAVGSDPGATTGGTHVGDAVVRWQRLGAAVFSPAAFVAYVCVVLAGIAVVLADPYLAPRRSHVFFTDSFVVIELSLFVLQLPLVLLHESAHVLAGRRLGLRTRLRLSRRLYFVVFETVMNGLVAVPRGKRYLPMLAGMLTDLGVAAAFTVAAWGLRGPVADVEWAAGLCLALAFTTLLRIAWQLYFFLRTDIYYLVTTVLGCVDLHATARQYLLNVVHRALGRHDKVVPDDAWHPRDRRAVRWYAPLVVVGYALAAALLVLVMLPIAWRFLSEAVGRAFLGDATSTAQLWDSALLLGLNGAQLGVAAVIALRERRTVRRSTTPTSRRRTPPRHRMPRSGSRSENGTVIPAPVGRLSRDALSRGTARSRRRAGGHARHRQRRP